MKETSLLMPHDFVVTVVSGLPRSGTSMMMRMLDAGGMETLTDGIRGPDVDNPRGYYELERVKRLKEDSSWLKEARGKAVKVISRLLYDLPPTENYKIIFMRRPMEEILASQRRMLERLGKATDAALDEQAARAFEKHIAHVERWLEEQGHMEVLHVSYNGVIARPLECSKLVNAFLGGVLQVEKMAAAVEASLYRQRRPGP